MTRKLKRWLVGIALMLSAMSAIAGNTKQGSESAPVIKQMFLTHHDFEDWTFTPKVNDTVLITNNSAISHSIYVTYPDGSVVNLGVQLPGATVTWIIPATGDYLLQCWIHPIIRAEMTVSP